MARARTKYAWKEGARYHGDAATVGRALMRIERTYGGIEAPLVVKEAESPQSPLHDYFEWDDAVAGVRFREEQARSLIRHVQVVRSNGSGTYVRAFVVVEDAGGEAYQSIAKVMSNEQLRSQLLRRARAELETFRRKYRDLKELSDVFAAIEKVQSEGGKR
jgi:hypothetical protein